jgi:poly(A) polymerase
MDHAEIFGPLVSAGFSVNLCGFSAIDRYLGRDPLPFVLVETDAGLSDLARHFEGLRFPGTGLADGAVEQDGCRYLFRCLDPEDSRNPQRGPSFKFLGFNQDWATRRFRDPWGFYPLLRQIRDGARAQGEWMAPPARDLIPDPPPWWEGLDIEAERWRAVMDGALILARYSPEEEFRIREINQIAAMLQQLPKGPPPSGEEQRTLLLGMLSSPRPGFGLELLKASGFIAELWPELALLDDVDHSKEFHPEGNVWKHTMETFRYRKTAANSKTDYDFRLSLGLLLHDVGKPISASSGGHRFEGHAELGARQARKFLERLGFEKPLIEDIYYLVKNHMLPAALPRLPLIRTGEIMESPLFPVLMELYRCDESSSFKGLDAYYESSAAFQSYLRNRRNPYRSADGKKIGRREMLSGKNGLLP